MKKLTILATFAVAISLFSFINAPSTWTLDKSHAKLGFSVTHLSVSEVEGSFKIFDATINAVNDDFTDATVSLSADAASVNTDSEQRDTHLKSADFFDVTKFPTITFTSTSFKKVSEGKYKVIGNLTMHGVTKSIELEAKAAMGTNPMSKKTIAGFKITGKIKRTDFGISASTPSAMVSDEIAINANAEFVKN
jgi:polyisoprenoid-binding protein YceI